MVSGGTSVAGTLVDFACFCFLSPFVPFGYIDGYVILDVKF